MKWKNYGNLSKTMTNQSGLLWNKLMSIVKRCLTKGEKQSENIRNGMDAGLVTKYFPEKGKSKQEPFSGKFKERKKNNGKRKTFKK